MSSNLMKFLLIIYGAICVASLFEKNWTRLEYWVGAALIVHATLRMI